MPRMRKPVVALVATLALAAATLLGATSAFAHAEPSAVTPAAGAVLNTAPTQVTMDTVEEMSLVAGSNDLVVTGPSGVVSKNPATVDASTHSHISVQLQTGLATGLYTVAWHTVSGDDGDAASGTWTFTYDPSKPASAGNAAPPTAAPEAAEGSPAATASPAAPATGSGGAAGTGSPGLSRIGELGAGFILVAGVLGFAAVRRRNVR
jgi:copper resistance protein C